MTVSACEAARRVPVEDEVARFDDLGAEGTIPIRPAGKRICRGYRAGESYDSDCRTLSSRPTVNISASLCSYQSRSQSVAWSHGTLPRNKIRRRSFFEVAAHM